MHIRYIWKIVVNFQFQKKGKNQTLLQNNNKIILYYEGIPSFFVLLTCRQERASMGWVMVVDNMDFICIQRLQQVDISQLEQLYCQEDLYSYLLDDFFQQSNASIYILQEDGRYISALRIAPYADGYLVHGLATAKQYRNKGYGKMLLKYVRQQISGKLYSHIDKRNTVSLRVHYACGFAVEKESARMLDGTVTASFYTLVSPG